MKNLIPVLLVNMFLLNFVFSQNSVIIKNDSVIVKDKNGNVADTAKFILKKCKVFVITDKENRFSGDTLKNNGGEEKTCTIKRFRGNWAGIEFGLNNYLDRNSTFNLPQDAKLLELNTGKSWQFNLNIISKSFGLYKDIFGIVTGLGFAFNNYRFEKQVLFMKDSTPIKFALDTINKYKKDKLAVTYLTLPIIFEYQIPYDHARLHISAGIIGSLKLGSKTKLVEDNGDKNVIHDDYNLSPFKLETTLRLGYGGINIFANYSLVQMFEQNKGPELFPLTLGIGFSF